MRFAPIIPPIPKVACTASGPIDAGQQMAHQQSATRLAPSVSAARTYSPLAQG